MSSLGLKSKNEVAEDMLRVVVAAITAGRKVCLVEERLWNKEDRRVVWQRRGAINMGKRRARVV